MQGQLFPEKMAKFPIVHLLSLNISSYIKLKLGPPAKKQNTGRGYVPKLEQGDPTPWLSSTSSSSRTSSSRNSSSSGMGSSSSNHDHLRCGSMLREM